MKTFGDVSVGDYLFYVYHNEETCDFELSSQKVTKIVPGILFEVNLMCENQERPTNNITKGWLKKSFTRYNKHTYVFVDSDEAIEFARQWRSTITAKLNRQAKEIEKKLKLYNKSTICFIEYMKLL